MKNLNFKYENSKENTINDVSFNIKRGEWVSVIGHNGSGKSTLIKLLDGLLPIDSGSITINDNLVKENNLDQIRKSIGLVFQNPDNQFVGATVEDDIAFGLENNQFSRNDMNVIIDKVLKVVDMSNYRTHEPSKLSGGQKQRIALAGVLALSPKILILDEATSMIDPQGRNEILDIINNFRTDNNMTVISITHDVEEIKLSSRVLLLKSGMLIEDTNPYELFNSVENLEKYSLEMPFSAQLSRHLINSGLDIPNSYMDEEELIKCIKKLYLKM
ncbi:abc superfamily atp binding cassette transporter, abc protein [Apilactobacillus ozensis DSM 23829 = JCM 17196]|uniref:Abc superfamily atp binding cassette transporter, abc protein n=1 Tax=Apilactobacillus ozensis DSM 23829 = JCM 17196 TaxID=1423781 RepID=A0A0R2AM79_9LACO|nr:abc superfamily atp binding cassette transporter, abc protein [Apilactobacillus ozensis DSM 23829 = JCM 17196]